MDSNDWRPVVGWQGYYEVSRYGAVRSVDRTVQTKNGGTARMKGREIKFALSEWGYRRVFLSRDSTGSTRPIHILVAEAFLGPRPDGLICCHKDGNKENNCADNLRWDTHASNSADAIAHGVAGGAAYTSCGDHPCAKLPERVVIAARTLYKSKLRTICGMARYMGAPDTTLRAAVKGTRWKKLSDVGMDIDDAEETLRTYFHPKEPRA